MSFGYCGSLSNDVSANLRIDGSGVRFTAAADVALSIAAGDEQLITFTVVVPRNVGYASINWGELISGASGTGDVDTDQTLIDYVGWVTNGELVSESSTLAESTLHYTDPVITASTSLSSAPVDSLFSKFEMSFKLKNAHDTNTYTAQKVIAGFTYNVAPPNTGQVKFDIYATVKIV